MFHHKFHIILHFSSDVIVFLLSKYDFCFRYNMTSYKKNPKSAKAKHNNQTYRDKANKKTHKIRK